MFLIAELYFKFTKYSTSSPSEVFEYVLALQYAFPILSGCSLHLTSKTGYSKFMVSPYFCGLLGTEKVVSFLSHWALSDCDPSRVGLPIASVAMEDGDATVVILCKIFKGDKRRKLGTDYHLEVFFKGRQVVETLRDG